MFSLIMNYVYGQLIMNKVQILSPSILVNQPIKSFFNNYLSLKSKL